MKEELSVGSDGGGGEADKEQRKMIRMRGLWRNG